MREPLTLYRPPTHPGGTYTKAVCKSPACGRTTTTHNVVGELCSDCFVAGVDWPKDSERV